MSIFTSQTWLTNNNHLNNNQNIGTSKTISNDSVNSKYKSTNDIKNVNEPQIIEVDASKVLDGDEVKGKLTITLTTDASSNKIYSIDQINEENFYAKNLSFKNYIDDNNNTYSLDEIKDYAFNSNEAIIEGNLTLPNTLKSIGEGAFQDCSGLISIDLSQCTSLNTFGYIAFNGCSRLSSISLPNSLETIGESAFTGCPIKNVNYDDKDNTHYKWATNAGGNGHILLNGNSPIWNYEDAIAGGIAFGYITVPTDVTINEFTNVLSECPGINTIDFSKCDSLTTIGVGAFHDCSGLTKIAWPLNLTTIDDYAFSNCDGLTSIEIPNTVTSIGEGAFQDCIGLTSFSLPTDLTSIPNSMFSNCIKLKTINLSEYKLLNTIGNNAFGGCSELTSINLIGCNFLTTVMGFQECSNLSTLIFNENITTIGTDAFRNCSKLTSIDLSKYNDLTTIDNYAFAECSNLSSFIFPNSLNKIQKYSFYKCLSLNKIDLTTCTTLSTIGISAFENCSGLTTIYLPYTNTLTTINKYAFAGCPITDVHFTNNNTYMWASTTSVGENGKVLINQTTSDEWDYQTSPVGCLAYGDIQVDNKITRISSNLFAKCWGLKTIDCSKSKVTYIDTSFCDSCSNLTSVLFPTTISSINSFAFRNCSKLKSIDLSTCNLLTRFASSTFENCTNLESILFPNTKYIQLDSSVFLNSNNINSIKFNWNQSELESLDMSKINPGWLLNSGVNPKNVTVHVPTGLIKAYEAINYKLGIVGCNITDDQPTPPQPKPTPSNDNLTLIVGLGAGLGIISIVGIILSTIFGIKLYKSKPKSKKK